VLPARALPTRTEADAILATQPWARVCKELALYVAQLSGTSEGATAAALKAIAQAREALWSFHERPLWTFLTDLVRSEATSHATPEDALALAAKIPMLGNDELDRELRRHGLDPADLSALGASIKKEAIERAPPRTTTPRSAQVVPARVPPPPGRDHRPEVPTLSRAQWAALSMVVLVTAALAVLGAVAASGNL
jgi:hypothetical protein